MRNLFVINFVVCFFIIILVLGLRFTITRIILVSLVFFLGVVFRKKINFY